MESRISRRDFLRLMLASSPGLFVRPGMVNLVERVGKNNDGLPNVFIFLFDALSAHHMSLYGYERNTTPNLARFAERANVYHRHYASGNFTTPGTASLLTGSYPWTHRALNNAGLISKDLITQNLFKYIGDAYFRAAYSQNLWSDIFLEQFEGDIEKHLCPTDFSLLSDVVYSNKLAARTSLEVFRGFEDFLSPYYDRPGSLVFSFIKNLTFMSKHQNSWEELKNEYPYGIPNAIKYNIFFLLEQTFDGVISQIKQLPQPAFAYFHFFSPHEPYCPHRAFVGLFDDGWSPVSKPRHPLSGSSPDEILNQHRRAYDEFIANVDAEFGRLFDFLDRSGYLENSYVIVTSDHGQSFERGFHGHSSSLLYDPLIHVPLIISSPGQVAQNDFYMPTSCVDVLPTLLKVTGRPQLEESEGRLLPGLGGDESEERAVFSIDAKENPAYAPLTKATVAMMKGDYKLIWYGDYPGFSNQFEMYDLKDDPEELENIYHSQLSVANKLKAELRANLIVFDDLN